MLQKCCRPRAGLHVGDGRLARPAERGEALWYSQFRPAPAICYPAPCDGLSLDPMALRLLSTAEKASGCVFCDAVKAGNDAKTLIVYRGKQCFVILNAYPYTPGHV